LQFWVALPAEQEACDPAFSHHAADALPQTRLGGARLRLVAGSAYGLRSPVRAPSPLFLMDVHLAPGAHLELEDRHAERAAYVVEGTLRTGDAGPAGAAGQLLVFDENAPVLLEAGEAGARCVLFGGAALDAPRFLWWNFVSSQRERIAEAKARWTAQTFAPVPGETDFVPLPPERAPPAAQTSAAPPR
ncbi:MAG: pirin-like C-terminal cupin domain-containing protein, partial [Rhodoferax sp.]